MATHSSAVTIECRESRITIISVASSLLSVCPNCLSTVPNH